jgi:hypothetical protein
VEGTVPKTAFVGLVSLANELSVIADAGGWGAAVSGFVEMEQLSQ